MDEIALAGWGDRFWAWLIDVLLMSLLWHSVLVVLNTAAISRSGMLLLAASLFIYWTALEGYRGQSFGKMLLNLVVAGPVGEHIRFRDAALEAFGKAFLLPVDFLVGWLYFRKNRQRLFNRISNTVVFRRKE